MLVSVRSQHFVQNTCARGGGELHSVGLELHPQVGECAEGLASEEFLGVSLCDAVWPFH